MHKYVYLTIEGIASPAKEAIVAATIKRLNSAGNPTVRFLESKAGQPATDELVKMVNDPSLPIRDKSDCDLYQAARRTLPNTILPSKTSWLADRGALSVLVESFYGRGVIGDYARANQVIDYATKDSRPSLTVVIDSPTSTSDGDGAIDERLRAGYLWEAKQRDLPLVFASGLLDSAIDEVWVIICKKLGLDTNAKANKPEKSKPTSETKVGKSELARLKSQKNLKFYPPKRIPKKLLADYDRTIKEILDFRSRILSIIGANSDAALAITPLACYYKDNLTTRPALASLASELSEGIYGEAEPVKLVSFSPRNEFELLAPIFYASSTLDYRDLAERIDQWSYDKKATALKSASTAGILVGARYTWEVTASYFGLIRLQQVDLDVEIQPASPRFGFDAPKEVDAAGLSDEFERAFAKSVELYSKFQAAGYESEAYRAVLFGHKARAKICLDISELAGLLASNHESDDLVAALIETVASVHPLLYGQYFGGVAS